MDICRKTSRGQVGKNVNEFCDTMGLGNYINLINASFKSRIFNEKITIIIHNIRKTHEILAPLGSICGTGACTINQDQVNNYKLPERMKFFTLVIL